MKGTINKLVVATFAFSAFFSVESYACNIIGPDGHVNGAIDCGPTSTQEKSTGKYLPDTPVDLSNPLLPYSWVVQSKPAKPKKSANKYLPNTPVDIKSAFLPYAWVVASDKPAETDQQVFKVVNEKNWSDFLKKYGPTTEKRIDDYLKEAAKNCALLNNCEKADIWFPQAPNLTNGFIKDAKLLDFQNMKSMLEGVVSSGGG